MTFSARTLYLSLAFCITLLFTATGIYYLLSSSSQQQINNITTPAEKNLAQAQITPEPTLVPTSIPTPIVTPGNQPDSIIENDSSVENTNTEKLDSFLSEMEKSCYEPCEFNYQCPSNLSCITVNDVKICANSRCSQDDTCTCKATPSPTILNSGIGGPTTTGDVKGLITDNTQEYDEYNNDNELDDFNEVYSSELEDTTPSPTPSPTPIPKIDDLPEAGSPQLTFLVLILGISLSVLGFTWLKH